MIESVLELMSQDNVIVKDDTVQDNLQKIINKLSQSFSFSKSFFQACHELQSQNSGHLSALEWNIHNGITSYSFSDQPNGGKIYASIHGMTRPIQLIQPQDLEALFVKVFAKMLVINKHIEQGHSIEPLLQNLSATESASVMIMFLSLGTGRLINESFRPLLDMANYSEVNPVNLFSLESSLIEAHVNTFNIFLQRFDRPDELIRIFKQYRSSIRHENLISMYEKFDYPEDIKLQMYSVILTSKIVRFDKSKIQDLDDFLTKNHLTNVDIVLPVMPSSHSFELLQLLSKHMDLSRIRIMDIFDCSCIDCNVNHPTIDLLTYELIKDKPNYYSIHFLMNHYDINQCQYEDMPLLIYLVREKLFNQVAILMDYNIDISVKDKQGRNCLYYACVNADTQMMDTLYNRGVKIDFDVSKMRSDVATWCQEKIKGKERSHQSNDLTEQHSFITKLLSINTKSMM